MWDFVQTILPALVQLSFADGSVQDTTESQEPKSLDFVISVGQPTITGTWVSLIVTSKLHVTLTLPDSSSATYVTTVVPKGKIDPGVWDFVQVILPDVVQLSATVGSTQVTTALHESVSLSWVISVGQSDITGISLSVMVTVKLQLVVLLEASVTSKVLIVSPTGKALPLINPAVWTVLTPGQLSVPTGAVKVTTAPQVPASIFWVISVGHVISGSWLSVTVILKLPTSSFPLPSVTV